MKNTGLSLIITALSALLKDFSNNEMSQNLRMSGTIMIASYKIAQSYTYSHLQFPGLDKMMCELPETNNQQSLKIV